MNYIKEYYSQIKNGSIITSKRVEKIYKKLVEDMDHKDGPFYFDKKKGNRPIEFIEKFCKQSQGLIGSSLKLELFQKAYIQALFGFLEKNTGYRRFRETLFLVARKNGKSTMLTGIALYLLIADQEGAAEIYSVSTKKDAAVRLITESTNMIRQSPELRALIKKRRADIYFPMTSSYFMALASDSNTLDGLNAHGVIIDELHAIRDRNLYEVMKQAQKSRRQPILVMITTAGTVRECIFDDMYEYSAKVADGEIKDDRFLPVMYELDNRDEWTNPSYWLKANPGLGVIKNYQSLADDVERAKNDNKYIRGFLCKDFNVRENESNSWLTFEEINNEEILDIKDIYNTYAIGGCDLSATTDLTCATLLIRKKNDQKIYVLQKYFLPQARIDLLDSKNSNEAPYKIWADRGLLTICEGNRVNYSQVTEWFVEMREKYKIDPIKIGYDRALAGYWVDEMKSNAFDMEPVAQGPFTWSQPMHELGAALSDKKINYNNNPILKWCLSNTAVKKTGLNNIQPVKITERRRIDGAVSLLNAYVLYVKYFEDLMYSVG